MRVLTRSPRVSHIVSLILIPTVFCARVMWTADRKKLLCVAELPGKEKYKNLTRALVTKKTNTEMDWKLSLISTAVAQHIS